MSECKIENCRFRDDYRPGECGLNVENCAVSLKAAIATKDAEIAELNLYLSERNHEIENCGKQINEQHAEIERLNEAKIFLDKTLEERAKDVARLYAEAARLKAENEALRCCGSCNHLWVKANGGSWFIECKGGYEGAADCRPYLRMVY